MTLSHPEPISPTHLVEPFDCGNEELNDWLTVHALASHRSESARTYVTHDGGVVMGYYSLAVGSVRPHEAPDRVTTGLGRHDVPIAILARLGVDLGVQGQGVGRGLVKDALLRVAGAADLIGIRALLVHMKTPDLRAFYERFGFEDSPVDRNQVFLLMKDLRTAIRSVGR